MCKLSITITVNKEVGKKVNTFLENKKVDIHEYVSKLIDEDINSKIYFEKDFYFHYKMNKLFNGENEISFSKLEYKIFKYLLDNVNKLIKYDELLDVIGINKRNNLCNIVTKIRAKTYRGLIKSVRDEGYVITIIE